MLDIPLKPTDTCVVISVPHQLPVKRAAAVISHLLQVFGQYALPEEGPRQRGAGKQESRSVASTKASGPGAGVRTDKKTSMWFQARPAPLCITPLIDM